MSLSLQRRLRKGCQKGAKLREFGASGNVRNVLLWDWSGVFDL